MPFIKKDDIDIYYETHGTGKPLIFISGLGQKSGAWQFQVPYFAKKMKVITFDNRGTGRSSRPDFQYTMDMYVNDLSYILDFLNIKAPVNLCGLSMGGMIAQNFALMFPERIKTLTLLSTTPKLETNALIESIQLTEGMDEERFVWSTFAVYYSKAFRDKIRNDRPLYEKLRADILDDRTRISDYINQGESLMTTHDTTERLDRITVPVLIIAGTGDLIFSHERSRLMHERLPDSRLEIMEGPGHVINIEAHEKVNSLIDEFLEQNS